MQAHIHNGSFSAAISRPKLKSQSAMEYLYIDGSYQNSGATGITRFFSTIPYIGCLDLSSRWWNGTIANVQIYNTTMDANQVLVLYQDGIGGAPITIQNLVGWWPLNGNANDYSGNNNNGQATNVIYTSSWTSGYSQP